MLLVVGSYAGATDPGIHLFYWDADLGRFQPGEKIRGIENPSYLDVSKDTIYVITENKEGSASQLNIYTLQQRDGGAIRRNVIPFVGAGSCYISTDLSKTHAFIANYGEGSVTVIRLPQGSASGEVVQQLQFSGSGPDKARQDQSHLHTAVLTKDGRYLYCTDLGADRLYRFLYDRAGNLPLQAAEPPYLELPPGSGPRHLAFSPDGRWLYLVTELSGEIFVLDTNEPGGAWVQRIPLTQQGYCGKIEGGDIQVHAGGRFLYASNRGDANEIVAFTIDPHSGRLEFLQRTGAAGLSPRGILICEQPALLLVANEQSANISIFKLQSDGTLEYTRQHLQVPAPTCLKQSNCEIK